MFYVSEINFMTIIFPWVELSMDSCFPFIFRFVIVGKFCTVSGNIILREDQAVQYCGEIIVKELK